jgi:hypothetical protein
MYNANKTQQNSVKRCDYYVELRGESITKNFVKPRGKTNSKTL